MLPYGCAQTLTMAEGDVDGIMERPSGSSEQEQRAREKWYVVVMVWISTHVRVNICI